ncbi:MAG: FHA domain-containing serine/threonine-protein kinase [Rubripirellula sp.]
MTDGHELSNQPWKLVVFSGPDQGRSYTLDEKAVLVIGRGSSSDTKIRDPRLSRIHCELRRRATESGDPWEIRDLDGAGGTFIDGVQVDGRHPMTDASTLRIGDTELRLQRESILDMATVVPDAAISVSPVATSNVARVNQIAKLEGQVFLRFQLEKLISTGQNSLMFKATDTKRDRPVAVKILKPQMTSSDQQRARFIRAMRTMLPIKHPNIVRTRKAGQTDHYCWATFDWVDGISVRELIARIGVGGVLDWKEVYRVAVHISRALEVASEHRIVHRNVTPSNLLRRSHDQAFLLTDVIFAKALEFTDAMQLTRPGDLVGDLGYVAPERLLDAANVDERSDQFSLGATLFELLTGNPPYQAASVRELISAFQNNKPTSPAATHMGLDERFCDVVMRMIQPNAAFRFPHPGAILDDLQRVGKLAGIDADWAQWN